VLAPISRRSLWTVPTPRPINLAVLMVSYGASFSDQ
jgi:hypothetical protein